MIRRLVSTMGRFNKRGAKNKFGNRPNSGYRDDWKPIVRENEKFESYYKNQGLIPEEEWEDFKATCQKNLPLTFRITGSKKHAEEIKSLFVNEHLPLLSSIKVEGMEFEAPKPFPWYPNELGFQIDLPKAVVRKYSAFAKTQRFLVVETEVGNISRQEAVSMIPPLVLDVEPHHAVLDLCAAPGSKTIQLVEALQSQDDIQQPTGFVMANDADYKRSHMLVHQVKRLNSPNFIVVNHDAQFFPKLKLSPDAKEFVKFDRILCDVPCTGDGTMRKNIDVWDKWGTGNALGLHQVQLNILNRGLQLLKKGGRLVYSTCSMNPIENEAIVAAALRKWGDQIRTVNCDDRLPGLVRRPGVSQWTVLGKDMQPREVGAEDVAETCFPPSEEEAAKFNLSNCMRIYPHLQNTGGFFVTVFEKPAEAEDSKKRGAEDVDDDEEVSKKQKTTAPLAPETYVEDIPMETVEKSTPVVEESKKKKEKLPRDANEEPFVFLPPSHKELVKCWDFYGIADEFPKDCTLVRNATGEPLRTIYFVAPIIKNILVNNESKLKVVYSGTKLFVSQKTDHNQDACPWRIQNESLSVIKKHLSSKRQFSCNQEIFLVFLQETFPNFSILKQKDLDSEFLDKIKDVSEGCCFINVIRNENDESLFLPLWRGKNNLNLMVSKQETFEYLYRIYGIETTKKDAAKDKPKVTAPLAQSTFGEGEATVEETETTETTETPAGESSEATN
ncbi:unnamed protein product [Kuraishia capsulata CBS 1993]|uniref:SAM-dependent MTase RsmB/NOP-type domain-containing protein n=1 Tax=Kuraishia capsulata CBS 1993 TaxID=1382522 RepID=W6MUU2_9ASCO|nr:uncharacterized protein KUCA_T00005534001 [Kuraishia capsulata CBS 1993]CDK29542.1 unnamed protein product [Kuraishia capsulata CBS 1993]